MECVLGVSTKSTCSLPELLLVREFNYSKREASKNKKNCTSKVIFFLLQQPWNVFFWKNVEDIRTLDGKIHRKLSTELSPLFLKGLEDEMVNGNAYG